MSNIQRNLAIVDERALIATVFKQLCEAIKPEMKVWHFCQPSAELLSRTEWDAIIFDAVQTRAVLACLEADSKYPSVHNGERTVKVACGLIDQNDLPLVDYVLDLYESPVKIIQVLKKAVGGPNVTNAEKSVELNRFAELNHRALTPRHIEVLKYSAQGMSSQQIADSLNVSVNTVRGYVQEIFTRLNVRNIAHAVSAFSKLQTLIDFEQ